MYIQGLVSHMISGSWIRWNYVTLNSWVCVLTMVELTELGSIWMGCLFHDRG